MGKLTSVWFVCFFFIGRQTQARPSFMLFRLPKSTLQFKSDVNTKMQLTLPILTQYVPSGLRSSLESKDLVFPGIISFSRYLSQKYLHNDSAVTSNDTINWYKALLQGR